MNELILGVSHLWVLIGFALLVVAVRRMRKDARLAAAVSIAGVGLFFSGLFGAVLVGGNPAADRAPAPLDVPAINYTPPGEDFYDLDI